MEPYNSGSCWGTAALAAGAGFIGGAILNNGGNGGGLFGGGCNSNANAALTYENGLTQGQVVAGIDYIGQSNAGIAQSINAQNLAMQAGFASTNAQFANYALSEANRRASEATTALAIQTAICPVKTELATIQAGQCVTNQILQGLIEPFSIRCRPACPCPC